MPTVLELIQAEREAQEEEDARPAFTNVDSIRAFITEKKPPPTANIALEMCVLAIEEREKCWYMELIYQALEIQADKLLEAYKTLDFSRRTKFIFQLSLWKNRNQDHNEVDYRVGFSYRFEKVHYLRLPYDSPVGSLQIRQRLRARPIPSSTFFDPRRGLRARSQPADEDNDELGRAEERPRRGKTTAKTLTKRKSRANDNAPEASPAESPTKKPRAVVEQAP